MSERTTIAAGEEEPTGDVEFADFIEGASGNLGPDAPPQAEPGPVFPALAVPVPLPTRFDGAALVDQAIASLAEQVPPVASPGGVDAQDDGMPLPLDAPAGLFRPESWPFDPSGVSPKDAKISPAGSTSEDVRAGVGGAGPEPVPGANSGPQIEEALLDPKVPGERSSGTVPTAGRFPVPVSVGMIAAADPGHPTARNIGPELTGLIKADTSLPGSTPVVVDRVDGPQLIPLKAALPPEKSSPVSLTEPLPTVTKSHPTVELVLALKPTLPDRDAHVAQHPSGTSPFQWRYQFDDPAGKASRPGSGTPHEGPDKGIAALPIAPAAATTDFLSGPATDLTPLPDLGLPPEPEFLALAAAPTPVSAGPQLVGSGGMTLGQSLPFLVVQIADGLGKDPGGTTTLTLSPEELGQVRMSFQPGTQGADRIVVMLSFDRPDTMDLFRRHADQLTEALRSAGYSGVQLDFGSSGGQTPRNPVLTAHAEDYRPEASALTIDPVPSVLGRRLAGTGSLDLRL